MQTQSSELIALEKKFWQSVVDEDIDAVLSMLNDPALMVGSHGAMKFGHDQYRQMAEQSGVVIKSFELSAIDVVFPSEGTAVMAYSAKLVRAARGEAEGIHEEVADSSVWTRKDGKWRCVMHTETPIGNR